MVDLGVQGRRLSPRVGKTKARFYDNRCDDHDSYDLLGSESSADTRRKAAHRRGFSRASFQRLIYVCTWYMVMTRLLVEDTHDARYQAWDCRLPL